MRAAASKAEGVRLAHETRVHGCEHHPIVGFSPSILSRRRTAASASGRAPWARKAWRARARRAANGQLLERVLQQADGIRSPADREGYGGEAAKRPDMTRIQLEDLAEDLLRGLAVVGLECPGGFFDPKPVWVGEPRPFVGEQRVLVFLEIDEHVAVREPCRLEVGNRLDDLAQRRTRLFEASRGAQGSGEIRPRLPEPRSGCDSAFQDVDRRLYLVLGEQRGPQQPRAVHIPRCGRLDGSKLELGACEAAGPEQYERLRVGGAQLRL